MVKQVEIVKVYKTRVWAEKDFFGTVRIMMQHEDEAEPFRFAEIHYDHRYTSNSHQHAVQQAILQALGQDAEARG